MANGVKIELPHLLRDQDRHGNARLYVRVHGRKMVRLREAPGSPAFLNEYTAALAAIKAGAPPPNAQPATDTLGWLCGLYLKSHPFRQLGARTQRVRVSIIEAALAEPCKQGQPFLVRDVPLNRLEPKAFKVLRDRKAATPGAANERLKVLRAVMKWALEAEHIKVDHSAGVSPLKYKSDGFKAWTVDEVKQFEARYPIGTKERLALALMLYTGVRRSDAVRLGPQHVKDGILTFTVKKTATPLQLPILPKLRAILDASPTGETTFIETAFGKPFTAAGFGNWFRDRCDRAGLKECSAHGLRKAGATIATENGATDKQLMAIFGWSSPKMAAHYSKTASQKKLASDAMHLLDLDHADGS